MSQAFRGRCFALAVGGLALALGAPAVALSQACVGTGAHDAHSRFASQCLSCHPCGGTLGLNAGLTLPGGRVVAGTITTTTAGTTCSVSCHAPPGQPAPTVSWTGSGPFACSSCHVQGAPPPAGGSGHPFDTSSVAANRSQCQECHVQSGHVSGIVSVRVPSGTIVTIPPGGTPAANPACESCHLGNGSVRAGKSPPLLTGWTSAAGDWHGTRSGTGSSGTLASPFVRGQAALACTACHDPHISGNAFHFKSSINGQALPAAVVSRAGVGAEQVCTSCHLGSRHGYCTTCHASDPQPAGSACFACHGHEGIRYFPWPTTPRHSTGGPPPGAPGDCWHCHSPGWAPVPTAARPVISAVTAKDATAYSVTVTWTTDRASSSFVEYGVTAPGSVSGDPALSTSHTVMLTGLTGPTTYVFRVRSADLYRNVAESPLATFQTADPDAPSAPVLDPGPWLYSYNAAEAVPLSWSIVTSPRGNPVQYRVVVDTLPTFTAPAADSGWISTPSYTAYLPTLLWPDQYYWRVQARDSVTLVASPWSSVGTFAIWFNFY